MSLEDIRRECSDAAKLLQPYIDGELARAEQGNVASHLEGCAGCRAAVAEQQWVRTSLQSMERERAPQSLRARILLELDGVDRKAQQSGHNSFEPARRLGRRVRELFRGGLIMIPAGAVAVALFVAARQGMLPGEPTGVGPAPAPAGFTGAVADADDGEVMDALARLQPQVEFPVQVARSRGEAQLVGAGIDDPGLWVRYAVPRSNGNRVRIVDRQVPAARLSTRGEPKRSGSGLTYYLDHDGRGLPVISFQVGGVAHVLTVEGRQSVGGGPAHERLLVHLADRLGSAHAQ